MVSEHISQMDEFDASYRSEYEKALKQTSATAVTCKILSIQTDKLNLINCPYSKHRNGLDRISKGECIIDGAHRHIQP